MNDITTYQPNAQLENMNQHTSHAGTHQPSPATSELVQWAHETDAATYIATRLARTAFVPRDFQGNEANVAAAILEGKSLGMDPMEALKSIYVVHGRPGLYAKAMLKMITSAGHKLYPVERTDKRVVLRAVRKEDPSVSVDYDWTIERAARAGYTSNAKYKTNPTEMLHWKAVSEAAKFTFSDVIGGAASVEDIEDGDFDSTAKPTVEQAKAVTAGAKKVQRKQAPKPEAVAPPAPPVVDAPQEVNAETGELTEEELTEVQYISKVDQGRISAGLEELGIMSPAEKRDVVKEWSGLEELRGVNGLTVEQGAMVLDRIEREKKIMHGE